jgi:broad specificity phosphatase PhoE
MEILFVRHGESTQNKAINNNEEYDKHNIILTIKGRKQAQATGKYIAKVFGKIDAIYHSPIYRCQETAEIIAKNLDFTKELIPDKLLLEDAEKSDLNKLTTKEILKLYKKLDKKFDIITKELNPFDKLKKYTLAEKNIAKKYNYEPNLDEVFVNYNKFLDQIKKTKHKRIVVIGHSGTTNTMTKIITGIDIYNGFIFNNKNISTSNCSICCVLYDDNKFELVDFPNNEHLKKVNEKYK